MDGNLAKIRHERSKKDFPGLSLEEGEFVEFAFSRAKIILMMIMVGMALGVIVVLLVFLIALLNQEVIDVMGQKFLFIILLALLAASVIMGLIALTTYRGNKLYVTNKRVIQLMMNSLVSSSTNTIDLISVEDVSFHQNGLLQRILHYGTLRLSTIGDETTYTFKYSDISPEDLETVSELISKAKKDKKELVESKGY
ncbi:PH domain-containing protein [Candidatus Saccharibacteria bacterium]|nr:PH domain-containing protein [Candidatus Saccharibacteria bacterium]